MASDIPSPCTQVCTLDEKTGLCRGCLRTLDEIAGWRDFDDAEKARVLVRIAERLRDYPTLVIRKRQP